MKGFSKQAVIIYGPPGSGKGTQAELLARNYNFIHFDTGRYYESILKSPRAKRSKILRYQKELFDEGKLLTPSWIIKTVSAVINQIREAGFSIVLSGSPRTLYEAFGKDGKNGEVALLQKKYGKKNISIILLRIQEKTSIKRNSSRFVCSICGLPILASAKSKNCAFCAGPMRKRSLDNPTVIKIRLKEYRNRTYPIIKEFKKRGFKIFEINGEPAPYKVHEQIVKKINLK